MTTNLKVKKNWFRIIENRALITPDELRRESGTNMSVFINNKPPAIIPKMFYDLMDVLRGRFDKNPYIK